MLSSKQRMIKKVISKACETQSGVYREAVIKNIIKYGDHEPDDKEVFLVRKEYLDAVFNKTIEVLGNYYYDAEDQIRYILNNPEIIGYDDYDASNGVMAGTLYYICCTVYDKKPLKNFWDVTDLNHYQNDIMIRELKDVDDKYSRYMECVDETNNDVTESGDNNKEISLVNVMFKVDDYIRRKEDGVLFRITSSNKDNVCIDLEGHYKRIKIADIYYSNGSYEFSDEDYRELVKDSQINDTDNNCKDDLNELSDDNGLLVKSNDGVIFLNTDEDYPNKLILHFDCIYDDLEEQDYFYLLDYSSYLDDYYSKYLIDNNWSTNEEDWWLNDYNADNLTFATNLIYVYDAIAEDLLGEYDKAITESGKKFRDYVQWQVIGYLNKKQIKREIISSDKLSYTVGDLNSKLKDALCEILFDDKGYTVYAYSKFEADLESPYEMLKYLHMANYRMTRCNFEINLEDGVIRLKSRYDTDWASAPKLTEEMLQRSINNPAHVLDEYGNGIVALSLGFSNAEDEIRKVEGPFETVEHDDEFVPEPWSAIDEDIPF